MKTRYEHRPGLFGLASIAAGSAAKNRETQTQARLTAPAGEIHKQSESQSEPATTENSNPSNSSGPLRGTCRSGITYQSRIVLNKQCDDTAALLEISCI
jgi:hypothetical protein